MGQFISKTRGGMIAFNVDIFVPRESAEAFANAMTGDDEDIFLAAETALRERVGRAYDLEHEELELGVADEQDVKDALREYARNG